jgi:NAD(P)-dependent dehydrogenase (short-subunit alcohol dehydrogenase family)
VRLAEEGARVVAVDLDLAHLEETLDRAGPARNAIETVCCDVTDGAAVAAMAAAACERFGRLDVLVNNVGGSAPGGPVAMDESVFDAQVAFNLKSVFLMLKHVLPAMERQGGGAVVNVSSTSGLRWTGAAQVAYAACKAGVLQLTRVVAAEYASRGIRVNAVVPGQLHTPMVEARLAGQRAGGDVDALLRQRVARIPLGFMGDGRDTAAAALYLASDEARFVTGAEIVVDGGMTIRCD